MRVRKKGWYDRGEAGLPPSMAQLAPRGPYADGWFALAASSELQRGKVLTRRLMGEDVVLYRSASGRVRATEAHCPHMGAHLGYGATVCGEDIVCPFHHFQFGPDGMCSKTGYGTAAPKARLLTMECTEVEGLVFVWRHALGKPSSWEIDTRSSVGFSPPYSTVRALVECPQDVIENIVDYGHFLPTHGIRAEIVEEPWFDGVRMGTTYRFHQAKGEKDAARVSSIAPKVKVIVQGIGVGYTEIEVPQFGLYMRTRFAVTPVDPAHADLRLTTSARVTKLGGGRIAGSLSPLVARALTGLFWYDTRKDFPIWEHRRYAQQPRLAKGDGPIVKFRRWSKQFYSVLEDSAGALNTEDATAHNEPPTPDA
ncbi:Rieske 2Fe-2S domain-containing protein [Streptomyces zagrosensis]|uniref:cholesterol 7-desaturase n=1 Tax=Streptomyces zagrosensis TaxID=1042984 RepID=A0A7W9QBY6_9ACTN|nr:Rieske 2Fe-2S domain-containing protein [Streptomyces zagrosensis]MBB5936958.1 nitrite reductase/ring-hydroxylating ferredoxin subunit [Streptomyces zagrosensis]